MDIIILGQPITILAMVIQPNVYNNPTGIVIFKSADKTLGVVPIDDNGYATLTINSNILGVGEHTITVFYPGDKNNAATMSPAIRKIIVPVAKI
jgi:hypothetical protein